MDSIAAAASGLRAGTLTAADLVDDAVAEYSRHGASTNAFIVFTAEAARKEARACDAEASRGHWRGPLHGIPISIKDLIDVEGLPTTAASRVLPPTPATRDAEVVARLRRAGAIIIGKTNLHEFACGTTNEDSAFGPVRNPLDLARIPGGSSGGSGAAVAAGIGLASVGTDTGGSIRIPSAFCGLVGLKPTYGEVPVDGVIPLCESFDHVGPMGLSVEDVALMWRVMATSAGEAARSGTPRLGVPSEYFFDVMEDDVRAAWDAAIASLARAGINAGHVSIPHAASTAEAYVPIVFRESWAWHRQYLEGCPERYTPLVGQRLATGKTVTAEDYAAAMALRERLSAEVEAALSAVDALVLPTMVIGAPRLGTTEVRFGSRVEALRPLTMRCTQLFDITGHPAITLPVAGRGPLPCSLQLVGHRHRTADLLAVAAAVERAL
jgi:aspartyl-tRNA(Asn)/glutamyl-tRNA(Gln) amidotransferase subunit A